MNTNVVKSQKHLKRRIERFFLCRSEGQTARMLIDALAAHSRAWIFGGMIRDIGLFGRKGFTSDIDIVVDSNRESLLQLLSTLGVTQPAMTRFGGIRFRYHAMEYDIWCLSDTWAFRENLIPLEDANSLFKTTLMTWDAILYDVNKRQVISPDNYLDDLNDRRLELVFGQTPNETGSLIKILRTIYNKRVEVLGPELCQYLAQRLGQVEFELLWRYERTHYRTNSFSADQITELMRYLDRASPTGDLKININERECQLAFHFNDNPGKG